MPRPFDVRSLLSLGPVRFTEAFRLQKEAEAAVKAGGREVLFLLEHAEVITIGRNADRSDLHVSEAALERLGIDLVTTDRGGKLTYHGPGQLVAYPILDLSAGEADIRNYVRNLEEVLILTTRDFGVETGRSPLPGRWSSIWTGNEKLAAIGIHLSRWVTTHGVALNVSPNLARFSLFIPCGITDGGVTSLERLLGEEAPSVETVARRFVKHFSDVFRRDPMTPDGGVGNLELAEVISKEGGTS
jgi:lipoyl(octanoyl) transferase